MPRPEEKCSSIMTFKDIRRSKEKETDNLEFKHIFECRLVFTCHMLLVAFRQLMRAWFFILI